MVLRRRHAYSGVMMGEYGEYTRRAIEAIDSSENPTANSDPNSNAGTSSSTRTRLCGSFNLPNGVLIIPGQDAIPIDGPASYRPVCGARGGPGIIAGNPSLPSLGDIDISELANKAGADADAGSMELDMSPDGPQLTDFRDPFYGSIFPQCYALAATTVIAYTLVIMLFITPRSFLQDGVVVLGRRGFTNGGTGSKNIGGRPWLQKVAAIAAAVSLTIATANTFKAAEIQYFYGIQNSMQLQQDVLGSTELKVIRIISDTFLWLAQAQTLIRLFPRHREKIIIKWTAFSLITLDVIFDSLDSFLPTLSARFPYLSFSEAIPALNYLFQLSLGVLYAAWVIYYSLMKKKYAYYHPQMRNMILVALLSIIAILVPIIFFVLDISRTEFIGWGDYVRWVGAAAASVIVWEWVERIEALEREERKGDILGREVFDGDEMVDFSDNKWPKGPPIRSTKSDEDDGGEAGGIAAARRSPSTSNGSSTRWPATLSTLTSRYRSRSRSTNEEIPAARPSEPQEPRPERRFLQPPLWPARPPTAVTPVSRTDTASADSTVYQVRFAPLTETTSRTGSMTSSYPPDLGFQSPPPQSREATQTPVIQEPPVETEQPGPPHSSSARRWRSLAHSVPFRRTGDSAEVGTGESRDVSTHEGEGAAPESGTRGGAKRDFRSRFGGFATGGADRLRARMRPTVDTSSLPVRVIPAPQRRGAALAQVLEDEEARQRQDQGQDHQLQEVSPLTDRGHWHRPSPSPIITTTPVPDEGPQPSPGLWRSVSTGPAARPQGNSDRHPGDLPPAP